VNDATVVTGSIRAVSFSGREFPVPAGCEAKLNLGGYVNTIVTFASGRSAVTQALTPWMVGGLEILVSDDRGDLGFIAGLFNAALGAIAPGLSDFQIKPPPSGPDREFLKQLIANADLVPMTFTLADETTWSGMGTLVGPVDTSTKRGVAVVDLAGDGELVKQ
jgi:hypothetical protein